MKVVDGLAGLDALALARHPDTIDKHSAVLVGVFDGVHLGHQRLLHELLEVASATQSLPTIVTFRNHPESFLRGTRIDWLVGLQHRLRLLRRAGVMRTVLLDFDAELRALTAEQFTRRVLVNGLGTRGLLLGYDAAIGKDREGTQGRMRELGREHGFTVREGSIFSVDGAPVSSTRIREAIRAGDLELGSRMLGRWPSVLGRVVRGDGRGKGLGFPTANLAIEDAVLPPEGVYAVEVLHDGEQLGGVANLGRRPTFEGGARPEPRLEVHVFGFDGDLYDTALEVAFVGRIRGERKFGGPDELRAQIAADAEAARRILAG